MYYSCLHTYECYTEYTEAKDKILRNGHRSIKAACATIRQSFLGVPETFKKITNDFIHDIVFDAEHEDGHITEYLRRLQSLWDLRNSDDQNNC